MKFYIQDQILFSEKEDGIKTMLTDVSYHTAISIMNRIKEQFIKISPDVKNDQDVIVEIK